MKPGTRRWLYAALALGLMAAAGVRVEPINDMREAHDLVVAPLDVTASPGMVLPILMSVGRAVVVDYLWLRATRLKDDGRYFDALQLSETICKLEPRFAPVWAFHAWNMAYNISVTQETGEERWRWVLNGIKLLRDEAIPINPHDTQLYRELAWIFFHKVADYMDDQHWYYKNQFAISVEDVLGPGGECDWEAMAAAPKAWDELAADERVTAFVQACRKYDADVAEAGVLLGLLHQRAEARRAETEPAEPARIWSALDDPKHAQALKAVEYYWRARSLWESFRLDPKRVRDMRETFGPLDFRLAEAHALYWSTLGAEMGTERAVRLDIDRLNADRIALYSIQNMFRRGKLIMSPEANKSVPPLLLPDPRFVPTLDRLFRQISERYVEDEPSGAEISMNFESAYRNFMRDAITSYYEAGDREAAQEWYDRVRETFPDAELERDLDAYVVKAMLDQLVTPTIAQALHFVRNYVLQSFDLFAYGRQREGLNFLRLARMVYDKYQADVSWRNRLSESFDDIVLQSLTVMKDRYRPEMYERLTRLFDQSKQAMDDPGG
ncbi:MAG: hypothetical protein V3T70_01520 [Phycisphaerae bacterium]